MKIISLVIKELLDTHKVLLIDEDYVPQRTNEMHGCIFTGPMIAGTLHILVAKAVNLCHE